MKTRHAFIAHASAAAFLLLATSAQAERLAFMPLGEVAAAPPGFADLCQRDTTACGAEGSAGRLTLTSASLSLTTSSLGGGAPPSPVVAPLRTDRSADAEAEAPVLVQFAELEAYRPQVDSDFTPAGTERQSEMRAENALAQDTATRGRAPMLTKSDMRLVNTVNQAVNREVHKATDFDLYGLLEFWSLPRVVDGKMYGDCEDYALEKRRRLIAAGVPAEALSIAVAVTARGETHAVLVVSFESGDWVLDNLTPWATPWKALNYTWVERQVAGSSEWKKIA